MLSNLISLARIAQAKENLKDKPALACLPPLKLVDPNAPPASDRPSRPSLQKSATDSRLASRWNKVAAGTSSQHCSQLLLVHYALCYMSNLRVSTGEKVDAPAPSADSIEADPEYMSSGLMADQLNALTKRLEKELGTCPLYLCADE